MKNVWIHLYMVTTTFIHVGHRTSIVYIVVWKTIHKHVVRSNIGIRISMVSAFEPMSHFQINHLYSVIVNMWITMKFIVIIIIKVRSNVVFYVLKMSLSPILFFSYKTQFNWMSRWKIISHYWIEWNRSSRYLSRWWKLSVDIVKSYSYSIYFAYW